MTSVEMQGLGYISHRIIKCYFVDEKRLALFVDCVAPVVPVQFELTFIFSRDPPLSAEF